MTRHGTNVGPEVPRAGCHGDDIGTSLTGTFAHAQTISPTHVMAGHATILHCTLFVGRVFALCDRFCTWRVCVTLCVLRCQHGSVRFHETCVACPCSVESRLIECCDRHGRLSGVARRSRWSRAARLRPRGPPQSAVVLARGLSGPLAVLGQNGTTPKFTGVRIWCSAAQRFARQHFYNAPHAAIRLIRQGFGREREGHCAKAAWRAACSCWRSLLRRPRGFLHWSPRASCFPTHGSRRTDMARALRSSIRPRPRVC